MTENGDVDKIAEYNTYGNNSFTVVAKDLVQFLCVQVFIIFYGYLNAQYLLTVGTYIYLKPINLPSGSRCVDIPTINYSYLVKVAGNQQMQEVSLPLSYN